jgi:SMC interacting uncharacterized protein involved in chromosome segregation
MEIHLIKVKEAESTNGLLRHDEQHLRVPTPVFVEPPRRNIKSDLKDLVLGTNSPNPEELEERRKVTAALEKTERALTAITEASYKENKKISFLEHANAEQKTKLSHLESEIEALKKEKQVEAFRKYESPLEKYVREAKKNNKKTEFIVNDC